MRYPVRSANPGLSNGSCQRSFAPPPGPVSGEVKATGMGRNFPPKPAEAMDAETITVDTEERMVTSV